MNSAGTLIAPDQTLAIFALLLGASLLGMVGEERQWFRYLGGILFTLIATATLSIIRVLPSSVGPVEVPAYSAIGTFFMPMAVPLLLFNADLRRIARESGRLLVLYCLGAATAVVGILIATFLIELGPAEWAAASLFTATWTGGLTNLMAIADIFQLRDTPEFVAVVSADGFLNTLLMIVLFVLPAWTAIARWFTPQSEARQAVVSEPDGQSRPWSLEDATAALTISVSILAFSAWISPKLQAAFDLNFRPNLIVTTLVMLTAVNLRPAWFQRFYNSAYPIGVLCLYLFIAEIGVSVDLVRLLSDGPAVLLFGTIAIVVHIVLLLIVGGWLRFSLKEICIASNACIGGPTTAAPMALSFGMKHAVTPAILIGLFGYMIGTFVALAVAAVLR